MTRELLSHALERVLEREQLGDAAVLDGLGLQPAADAVGAVRSARASRRSMRAIMRQAMSAATSVSTRPLTTTVGTNRARVAARYRDA